MKKKLLLIIVISTVLALLSGCFLFIHFKAASKSNLTNQEITSIYTSNKVLLNSIKDELISSKYDDIVIYYSNNQVVNDSNIKLDEKLTNEAKTYFDIVSKFPEASINLRVLFGVQVIEFGFYDKYERVEQGIVYTKNPNSNQYPRLDKDWYIYFYGRV